MGWLVFLGIAALLAVMAACLVMGVWLRHNHVISRKSVELASLLGSTAGLVSSMFSAASLLFVVYSLRRQDRQRRDDVLREFMLGILKTFHERYDVTKWVPVPKMSEQDLFTRLRNMKHAVPWSEQGGAIDAAKFWGALKDALREKEKWSDRRGSGSSSPPERAADECAAIVALHALSLEASPDERTLLRSVIPVYLSWHYSGAILCYAFWVGDLETVRAFDALGLLGNFLDGEFLDAVRRFSK